MQDVRNRQRASEPATHTCKEQHAVRIDSNNNSDPSGMLAVT